MFHYQHHHENQCHYHHLLHHHHSHYGIKKLPLLPFALLDKLSNMEIRDYTVQKWSVNSKFIDHVTNTPNIMMELNSHLSERMNIHYSQNDVIVKEMAKPRMLLYNCAVSIRGVLCSANLRGRLTRIKCISKIITFSLRFIRPSVYEKCLYGERLYYHVL